MKKIGLLFMVAVLSTACVNQKVVQRNEDRLDVIEEYLRQNKAVKIKKIDRLEQEGQIRYTKEHKWLEKEAEAWKEDLEK
ncbi:MAG: hypothetical protein KGV57_00940 [Fusobacterium sp.]|nr:hypothetical protein [Fusobacterium sp.]